MPGVNTQTILIVDDEAIVIELLTDLLGPKYAICAASNADDGFKILEQQQVDCIICDVMMPGKNGFEFCERIKASDEFAHIPFVLLTAKADLEDKITGLKSRADVYVEKPFSPAYIDALVYSLLQNRIKIKEYLAQHPGGGIESITTIQADKQFLKSLQAIIEEHIMNPLLDTEYMASLMHMSRTSLYRRIREASELTPYEVVEHVRLSKSVALMQEGRYSMTEIAALTGYISPSQFSKSFKRKFGQTPLQYFKTNYTK